ncbi:hypothetical protein MPL3365_180320 [Mesorhizobium plurifarium]|uniref:Uncharacterized protein n=1 Tax=Mesorhizobium plurifarium TaxID=69974 RepID=A0A090G7B7_MESPL|nr:hypothetical protein MPL3365_180320 [Mesorhizobium plurifarium]
MSDAIPGGKPLTLFLELLSRIRLYRGLTPASCARQTASCGQIPASQMKMFFLVKEHADERQARTRSSSRML